MAQLLRDALHTSWVVRWELVRFAILFRLLEALVFAPISALVGHFLSGRPVLDSTDIVGFILSPRGCSASFVWATLLLTIRLVEQTGLTAIVQGATGSQRTTVPAAVRVVVAHLLRLVSIAAWILLAGLALVAPLLAVAGAFARSLLSRHDINYYLARRPQEFLVAAAVVSSIAVLTLGTAVWLAVRWRLVVAALLCERGGPRELLRSSTRLVRGNWIRAGGAWLATVLLILGLGLLSAWIGRLCAAGAARLVGGATGPHFVTFALVITVRTILTGIITMPGPCVSAAVFAALYRDLRCAREPAWSPAFVPAPRDDVPRRRVIAGRWLLALLPVVTCSVAVVNTVIGMRELYADRPVAVTAHRGGTLRSTENSVAAIREAIDVGAQFAEIDVQMSRDGVLVVTHDSDFSRLAGVSVKVWELTYSEIREIPLAPAASHESAAARAPTLDEVLEAARGRIRLNIELKYYGNHQPRLAERVVDAIRARGMADRVIIQSLHYAGLEDVRRAAPEIPIGYLFSMNAREPKRLEVDFLSVQIGRVSGAFINSAHRRGQEVHVWTVDKRSEMQRMIDLGVDNLITNRPRDALELVREQRDLPPAQRTLHRLRAWLTE